MPQLEPIAPPEEEDQPFVPGLVTLGTFQPDSAAARILRERENPTVAMPDIAGYNAADIAQRLKALADRMPSSFESRLASVEKTSKQTLPTTISFALAEQDLSDSELRSASRSIAKILDVDPSYIFGEVNWRDIRDPMDPTKTLTLATMRRMQRKFTPRIIESFLEQMSAPEAEGSGIVFKPGGDLPTQASRSSDDRRASPTNVAAIVEAMAPLRGDDLEWTSALAAAVGMEKDGVDPKRFEANLKWVMEFTNGPASVAVSQERRQEYDTMTRIAIAGAAAAQGQTFGSVRDVIAFLFPRVAELAEVGERVLANQEALREAFAADPRVGMAVGGLGQGGLVLAAGGGAAVLVVQNAIEGKKNEWLAQAKELEAGLVAKAEAFENSWFNRNIVKPVGALYHGILRETQALFVDLAATFRGGFDLESDAFKEWHAVADSIRHKGKTLTDFFEQEMGMNHAQAVANEFLFQWFTDPLIVGGKAIQTARQGRTLLKVSGSFIRPSEVAYEKALGKFTARYSDGLAEALAASDDGAALTKWMRQFVTATSPLTPFSERMLGFARHEVQKLIDVTRNPEVLRAAGITNKATERLASLKQRLVEAEETLAAHKALKAGTLEGFAESELADIRAKAAAALSQPLAGEGVLNTLLHDPQALAKASGRKGYAATVRSEIRDLIGERAEGILLADARSVREMVSRVRAILKPRPTKDELAGLRKAITKAEAGGAEATASQVAALAKFEAERAAVDARKVADEVLRGHFTGYAPEGSIARDILRRSSQQADEAVARALREPVQSSFDDLIARGVDDLVDATKLDPGLWVGLRQEIPTRRFLPGRAVREVAAPPKAESRAAKALRKAVQRNPGRQVPLHSAEKAGEWIHADAIRAGLTDAQANVYRRAVVSAGGTTGTALEKHIVEQVERFHRDVIKAGLAKHVPAEQLDDVAEEFYQGYQARRAGGQNTPQAFGTVGETAVREPIFETQLQNFMFSDDPLVIRDIVRHYVGTNRLLANAWRKALRKSPKVRDVADYSFATDVVPFFGPRQFVRSFTDTWRIFAVARPAYIAKIILIEEQARALATLQSVSEWALSGHLAPLKGLESRIGKRLIGRGLGRGKAGFESDTLLSAGERLLARGERPGLLERIGVGREEFLLVDDKGAEFIHVLSRSGTVADEPLASMLSGQREVLEHLMGRSKNVEGQLRYGAVEAGAKGHLTSWRHALENQIARSEPGFAGLKVVAQGGDEVAVRRAIARWADENPDRAKAISVSIDRTDTEEWFDLMASQVWNYTKGDAFIAQAVVDGAAGDGLAAILARRIPKGQRPTVHGAVLEEAFTPKGGWFDRFTNRLADLTVRLPENALNRQRYFKAWKRRSERAYLEALESSGQQASPEILKAIDGASTQFALRMNDKIMFDFSKNARIGEQLSMVAPFTQPYIEQYAAWSHILFRRNPGLLGYTRLLGELGESSGFIKRDPETGELVIPLDWLAFHIPTLILNSVFDRSGKEGGFNIESPLSALSFFYASSLEVDTDGLAGNVPIPLPSLAPWVQFPLQRVFKDTKNESLYKYLFAYGPGPENFGQFAVSLLPRGLQRALLGWMPSLNEDQYNGIAKDFLELQQWNGQTPDPEHAKGQARWFLFWRGLFQTILPGQFNVEFPTQPLNDQWNAEVEEMGYEAAKDKWLNDAELQKYSTIIIGKTITGRLEDYGISFPRAPSSDYYTQLLRDPEIAEYVKDKPWAAILFTLGTEMEDQQSWQAFAAQRASGAISYRPPENVVETDEANKFWNAVMPAKEAFDAQLANLAEQGLADTAAYDEVKRKRSEMLEENWKLYPLIGDQYLAKGDDGIVGFTFDSASNVLPPYIELQLRDAAADPKVRAFPTGKALADYFEFIDDLEVRMRDAGVRDLWAGDQYAAPFAREHDQFVAGLIASPSGTVLSHDASAPVPEQGSSFAYLYHAFFEGRVLRSLPTEGEARVQGWADSGDPQYQVFKTVEAHWERLKDAPGDVSEKSQTYLLYHSQREFIDQLYRTQGAEFVATLLFDRDTAGARKQYFAGVLARPAEFYTRFDFEQMGIPVSDQAADWLGGISKSKAQIAEFGRDNPGESTGDYHRNVDAWIASHLGQDATFDAAIAAMNDPLPLILGQLGFDQGDSKSAQAWRHTSEVVKAFLDGASARDMHGIDKGVTFDPEERQMYSDARKATLEHLQEWLDWSPQFQAEWDYLQGVFGDPVIEVFLPDIYFRLGGV